MKKKKAITKKTKLDKCHFVIVFLCMFYQSNITQTHVNIFFFFKVCAVFFVSCKIDPKSKSKLKEKFGFRFQAEFP